MKISEGDLFSIEFCGQSLITPEYDLNQVELMIEAICAETRIVRLAIKNIYENSDVDPMGSGVFRVRVDLPVVVDQSSFLEELANKMLAQFAIIVPGWGGEDRDNVDWTVEYHLLD